MYHPARPLLNWCLQLSHLAVWAVSPLLQAMALMAGPAGANHAVRAYCLRSLQATPPEQVGLHWFL